MNELPVRARILLAWKTDTEILTTSEAMKRAGTTDPHALLGVADREQIAKLPWRPRTENLWRITPKGWDARDRFAAVENLIHG
jgi:Tfp pilus assembly protein PilX